MAVIALVVGELTAYLSVDNDAYKRGIRDAKGDLDSLARDASRQSDATATRSARVVTSVSNAMAQATRNADKQGNDAGGKLSQGISQGIIRNSPLIVAAVSGALAAGAPAMIAGATSLFAGVGIVAQAQSVAVRSAWTDAWDDIKGDAFDSSTALQPVLVGLADKVADSFHRMSPLLQEGFEAAAPIIDSFTDSLIQAGENALPGLVRAIQASGPVFDGLGSLVEDIGTGLTGFFDALSAHAPAAGEAFAAIGDILETLLPALGDLLGEGAELASMVLPPLAAVLRTVGDALHFVAPALPAIVAGLVSMKIAKSVSDGIGGLGDTLSKLRSSITPTNAALGVMGTVIGLTVAAMQESEQQTDEWAQALLEGGSAASQARADMSAHLDAVNQLSSGLTGFGQNLMGTAGFLSIYADDAVQAKFRTQELLNAMDPASRAQALLTQATNDLSAALEGEGRFADDVAGAQRNYEAASAEAERQQAQLEQAIDGVTSAMIAQAEQALAAANSDYAYRQSLEGVDDQVQAIADAQRDQEDATQALADAQREHGFSSKEAADAERDLQAATERTSDATSDLEGSILAAANAAGRMASDALPAGTSELQRQQAAAAASLAELVRMRTEMGSNFPPALNAAIARLQASGVTMNTVAGQADYATGRLQNLAAQRPQPVAFLNNVPFFSNAAATQNRMNQINALRASPLAFLYANTSSAESQLNWAARNRTSYVTQYVQQVLSTIPLFHADGGAIGRAGGGVIGPGGPRDDLIPAIGPGGQQFRLSNGEHVLDARDVALMGGQAGVYAFRNALNAGKAQMVTPLGMADGGSLSGATGGSVRPLGDVHFHLNGTVDFTDRQSLRKAATVLYAEFVDIERSRK